MILFILFLIVSFLSHFVLAKILYIAGWFRLPEGEGVKDIRLLSPEDISILANENPHQVILYQMIRDEKIQFERIGKEEDSTRLELLVPRERLSNAERAWIDQCLIEDRDSITGKELHSYYSEKNKDFSFRSSVVTPFQDDFYSKNPSYEPSEINFGSILLFLSSFGFTCFVCYSIFPIFYSWGLHREMDSEEWDVYDMLIALGFLQLMIGFFASKRNSGLYFFRKYNRSGYIVDWFLSNVPVFFLVIFSSLQNGVIRLRISDYILFLLNGILFSLAWGPLAYSGRWKKIKPILVLRKEKEAFLRSKDSFFRSELDDLVPEFYSIGMQREIWELDQSDYFEEIWDKIESFQSESEFTVSSD
ncbi:hypothetical protein [Leptospira sarikeiensis]|uniref:Uncharacterized protein n=1 Tax=Leptospira sarikeiensis TaxID=2484943 RepID=A0A4R9K5E2_9LEPT|nr:hypothetical protein [Leptospira sarikeiensis]TGL61438.1 hypothetical protein EHQ64_10655 [Leptospira sarikeiensis]